MPIKDLFRWLRHKDNASEIKDREEEMKKDKAARKAHISDDSELRPGIFSEQEAPAKAVPDVPVEDTEEQLSQVEPEDKNKKKSISKKNPFPLNCYKNRELSWLQFNERVLNEAGNPKVPLAERLTFVSIYQTNLDEFFMVRVGTLMEQMRSGEDVRENKTNMSSEEQVHAILKEVKKLEKKRSEIYHGLMRQLEEKGIHIVNFDKMSASEQSMLEGYFDHMIAPFLSPMILGKQQPFPFLHNKELYAVVLLKSKSGKNKTGIVQCSNPVFKRLIEVPNRPGYFMLSEELILHFVSKLYPKHEIREKSIIRVTRNADIDPLEVFDEDLDYRNMMERMVRQRSRLHPVRLEHTRALNDSVIKEIAKYLEISVDHVIKVDTPLDMSYVFTLQDTLRDQTDLFYPKRSPRPAASVNPREPMLPQIDKKDLLLSYPYESMRSFIRLLNEAAEDDTVVSIKMTLYRVASRSKVVDALCEAAENGKEVLVLIELRARFDEQNNIEMSRRLENAGCQLIYGLEKYKVHSKLCLITRKTSDGFRYTTQIGTGNYNEKTAALYTDLCLMTANQEIGADAAEVFRTLLQGTTVEHTRQLLVAPKCLQKPVLEMMEAEIHKAKQGLPAYIGVKINSLTDKDIINKLIEASQAGVRVELIVRGICCLIPGIPGYTDHITVISIVGRFLEHSRIYRFGAGEDQKIYIASADFMTRNTLRRVEVAAPVYDPELRARIIHIFDTMMADDEKGKELKSDGLYHDRQLHAEGSINAQEQFYQEAYDASEKA